MNTIITFGVNEEMLKSKIKVILVENDIKQNELADKLGFKPQTLSSWITNTNTPTLNNAFKLAKELGCKVDDLWEYTED